MVNSVIAGETSFERKDALIDALWASSQACPQEADRARASDSARRLMARSALEGAVKDLQKSGRVSCLVNLCIEVDGPYAKGWAVMLSWLAFSLGCHASRPKRSPAWSGRTVSLTGQTASLYMALRAFDMLRPEISAGLEAMRAAHGGVKRSTATAYILSSGLAAARRLGLRYREESRVVAKMVGGASLVPEEVLRRWSSTDDSALDVGREMWTRLRRSGALKSVGADRVAPPLTSREWLASTRALRQLQLAS